MLVAAWKSFPPPAPAHPRHRDRSACSDSQSRTWSGSACQARLSRQLAHRVRRDRWRAETCRRYTDGTLASASWRATHRPDLRQRLVAHHSPLNTKVSSITSPSMKASSISPKHLPPRTERAGRAGAAAARSAPRRELSAASLLDDILCRRALRRDSLVWPGTRGLVDAPKRPFLSNCLMGGGEDRS